MTDAFGIDPLVRRMADLAAQEEARLAAQTAAREARRETALARYRARQAARDELEARLRASTDQLTVKLITLHTRTEGSFSAYCEGCESEYGQQDESPEWPCRTVLLLALHHGIDTDAVR